MRVESYSGSSWKPDTLSFVRLKSREGRSCFALRRPLAPLEHPSVYYHLTLHFPAMPATLTQRPKRSADDKALITTKHQRTGPEPKPKCLDFIKTNASCLMTLAISFRPSITSLCDLFSDSGTISSSCSPPVSIAANPHWGMREASLECQKTSQTDELISTYVIFIKF